MAEDPHLDTGEYDPEKYYDARAENSGGDCLSAVCAFTATDLEKRSMHKVQLYHLRRILKNFDFSGKEVLEYGCGAGRWIPFFRDRGARWHGVDISGKMLLLAAGRHEGAELKRVVDGEIPYPEESMDFVYSITVLHHNRYEAQERVMAEITRVLRRGGHFLLLEGVKGHQIFNAFPRDRRSWINLGARNGLQLRRQDGVGYWTLRTVLGWPYRLYTGKTGPGGARDAGPLVGMVTRIVAPIDLYSNTFLQPLLPAPLRQGCAILFMKA